MLLPETIEQLRKERMKMLSDIEDMKSEIVDKQSKVRAIEHLLGDENFDSIVENHFGTREYPSDGTYTEKLIYVLFMMGEATAKDIAIAMSHLEKEADPAKLFKTITLYASRLALEGKLIANKQGNTNLYSINHKVLNIE